VNFNSLFSRAAFRTPANPWDTCSPLRVGCVLGCLAFSLIRGLSSPLSADDVPSLFEWFIGTTPLCDSSQAYMRAVWLLPSPAALPPGLAAGVSEVSRFSCMKFLGVSGVFDYAGLGRCSRSRSCSCCLPRITKTSASGLHLFEARSPTPPIPCLRFTGSLAVAAQDSGPGGSLLLSCKTLSFSTSCRFSPAHCNGDLGTRFSI